jgi:hypothetical protein
VARGRPHALNGAFPCHAQWRSPLVDLAYRCGGSAGFAVCSHTTHRLPVSSLRQRAVRTPERRNSNAGVKFTQIKPLLKERFQAFTLIVSVSANIIEVSSR